MPALGRAAEEQAGPQLQLADDLPGDDQVPARRAERVAGVAELAVAAVVGQLEQAFDVSVGVGAVVGVAGVRRLRVPGRRGRGAAVVLMGVPLVAARVLLARVLLASAAAASPASGLVAAPASWRVATASASGGLAAASVLILFHLVQLTCTDESASRNRRMRRRKSARSARAHCAMHFALRDSRRDIAKRIRCEFEKANPQDAGVRPPRAFLRVVPGIGRGRPRKAQGATVNSQRSTRQRQQTPPGNRHGPTLR